MLKQIYFVVLCGLLIHAENVDVSSYSAAKTVEQMKRFLPAETLPEKDNTVVIVKGSISPNNKENEKNTKKDIPDKPIIKSTEQSVTSEKTVNVSINPNDTDTHVFPVFPHGRDHVGAVMRSFWVFLGLSIIVIIYFSCKAFKTRPGAPPPNTVRKYGVVGRRGDLEMLPLPLNEEEDDDTLFDAQQQQQQIR